jgi:hypothetical protein
VPRLEYLNLRHDAIGEPRRRRQVREMLESAHHLPSLEQLGPANGACLDVRRQRRDAESGLAVQELIDFVGK